MPRDLRISDLRFAAATREDTARGLLGFASFLLNDRVRVDGVAVRKTIDGRLTLAWPTRTDADGRRHAYLRPIDDATRRELEAQVLAALGMRGSAL